MNNLKDEDKLIELKLKGHSCADCLFNSSNFCDIDDETFECIYENFHNDPIAWRIHKDNFKSDICEGWNNNHVL